MSRAGLLAVLLVASALPVSALPFQGVPAPEPAPLPTPEALAAPAPGMGKLEFACAGPTDGATTFQRGSANAVYGCPIRVYDGLPGGNSLSPFGNIQLAVQRGDPTHAAFFSLHGPGDNGPTNRSRGGNTHTTFTTTDMGVSWQDSWTTDCPDTFAHGEGASGTMDAQGNVTIAYTWSVGEGAGTFHAYSMDPVSQDVSYMEHYCSGSEWAVDEEGRITYAHVVAVAARPGSRGPDRVVAAWHTLGEGGGTLRFAVDGGRSGNWTASRAVPGCSDISDPVAWDGKAWVACVVGEGYTARRARPGSVDLWSYDPATGNASFASSTGLAIPNPRLAVTPDGYFALAGTRRVAEQKVEVEIATGWHGRGWSPGGDLGPYLHAMMGGKPVRSAHVTAIAILEDTKTIFLVYKEWNRMEGGPVPDPPAVPPPAVPDPAALEFPRLTEYKKLVVSLDECTKPIAASEFYLGTTPEVTRDRVQRNRPQQFDDLFDGLETARMPDGSEWVFFAVNDYGAAQFGAIVGASGASNEFCPVVAPLPPPPVPALPQALAVVNPASYFVGSMVGLALTAMVGYLLVAKRKTVRTAAAKQK